MALRFRFLSMRSRLPEFRAGLCATGDRVYVNWRSQRGRWIHCEGLRTAETDQRGGKIFYFGDLSQRGHRRYRESRAILQALDRGLPACRNATCLLGWGNLSADWKIRTSGQRSDRGSAIEARRCGFVCLLDVQPYFAEPVG